MLVSTPDYDIGRQIKAVSINYGLAMYAVFWQMAGLSTVSHKNADVTEGTVPAPIRVLEGVKRRCECAAPCCQTLPITTYVYV